MAVVEVECAPDVSDKSLLSLALLAIGTIVFELIIKALDARVHR